MVTHDLEQNGVYAGIPAVKKSSFDEYVNKRTVSVKAERFDYAIVMHNQNISEEEVEVAWNYYYKKHDL